MAATGAIRTLRTMVPAGHIGPEDPRDHKEVIQSPRRLQALLTPRETCGPRRARALHVAAGVRGGEEVSKARDRLDRRVHRVVGQLVERGHSG